MTSYFLVRLLPGDKSNDSIRNVFLESFAKIFIPEICVVQVFGLTPHPNPSFSRGRAWLAEKSYKFEHGLKRRSYFLTGFTYFSIQLPGLQKEDVF